MLEIKLAVGGIAMVVAMVMAIVGKASRAAERRRVADRHRSLPSSMYAPQQSWLPPGQSAQHPTTGQPAPGPVQDW
ncbi:MAG: hypothetical protein QM733_05515 [Ilumatobacteraceae bacterium]